VNETRFIWIAKIQVDMNTSWYEDIVGSWTSVGGVSGVGNSICIVQEATTLLTDALASILKNELVGSKLLLPACASFKLLSKVYARPKDAVGLLNVVVSKVDPDEQGELSNLTPTWLKRHKHKHELVQR
jgi:hypothetical protein